MPKYWQVLSFFVVEKLYLFKTRIGRKKHLYFAVKYIQITRHSAGLSGLPQKHKLVFLTLKLLQLPSQAYFLKYCIFIKFLTLFVSIQIFLPSAKRLTVTPLMSLPSLSVFMMSFSLVHLLSSEITSKQSFSESSLIFISRLTGQVVLFSPECETQTGMLAVRASVPQVSMTARAQEVQQANKSSWIWTNHAPAKQCDWTRVHHQHHCCVDFRWKNSLSSCLKISQTWNQINRYLYVKTSMRERIPTRARRERGTRAFCEMWRVLQQFH